MLRMDQVHVIRHKVLIEGRSRRSVAREMGLSRNTVRRYLRESAPRRRGRHTFIGQHSRRAGQVARRRSPTG